MSQKLTMAEARRRAFKVMDDAEAARIAAADEEARRQIAIEQLTWVPEMGRPVHSAPRKYRGVGMSED